MITNLGMVSFIIVQFIYVIYQQTSVTAQYKINLKCVFKDILYPTLRSLQKSYTYYVPHRVHVNKKKVHKNIGSCSVCMSNEGYFNISSL